MKLFFNSIKFKFSLMFLASAPLMGCQTYWHADAHFGSTVNSAIRAQSVNPDAPLKGDQAQIGMDGVSAQKSIESYQNSFDINAAGKGLTTRSNSAGVVVGQ